MAFDAFDEGISLGGVRNKTEVRILICYIFNAVKQPMSKDTVTDALLEKGLTNYFEASTCFDDLVKNGNIRATENDPKLFEISENGIMISEQLENTLALTVRERAYECTLALLEQEKKEKENKVIIEKVKDGYDIICSILGGESDLMSIKLHLADTDQAKTVKKNFYKNPQLFYKVMIAVMTRNKELIRDALNDLDSLA